jgi:hypothetical protein
MNPLLTKIEVLRFVAFIIFGPFALFRLFAIGRFLSL